jgi:subtilisin family serine protease
VTQYSNDLIGGLLRGFAPAPATWVARAEAIPQQHGTRRLRLRERLLFRPAVAPAVAHAAEPAEHEELPAHSLRPQELDRLRIDSGWPEQVSRDWAWGGSTGRGVRVCVIDSGIDAAHPLVRGVEGAVSVAFDDEGNTEIEADQAGDVCGHGTACASIIRALAPDCSLFSVRVLGTSGSGSGALFVAGLRWALEQGFDVVNMSLSTTRRDFGALLHELADSAYFQRTILVASAHNMPIESYPWRFSSLISIGSHQRPDPQTFFYNPSPPVEFFAPGVDVEVAWLDGETLRCTGNSFATPHIAGICALVLAKHPQLKPFQLKSVLYLTASNVGGE